MVATLNSISEMRPAMIALDRDAVLSVRILVRPDGSEIHLDDIATTDQGVDLLDELDAAMDMIEVQIDGHDTGVAIRDADWRRRAAVAFRLKRRIRPRLQERIGELRKADRQAKVQTAGSSPKDGQRKAFVLAAADLLDHEVVTEIWARAREIRPASFGGGAA